MVAAGNEEKNDKKKKKVDELGPCPDSKVARAISYAYPRLRFL